MAESSQGATLTPTRLDALRLVAAGYLEWSTRTGSWEPKIGYRQPAFDWLHVQGMILEDLDAEPQGRVLALVPVHVTDAGREALRAAS